MEDNKILQGAERQKLISEMLTRHEHLLLHTKLYEMKGDRIENNKKRNSRFYMGERHRRAVRK